MFVSEFIEWAPVAKLIDIFIQVFPTSSDCFMWESKCGEYDDSIIYEYYKQYIDAVVTDYMLRSALCRNFDEDGTVQEFLEAVYEAFEDDIKAKYEELENEGFVCQGTEPLPELLVEKNDLRTQLEKAADFAKEMEASENSH